MLDSSLPRSPYISISIVSHLQYGLVEQLLGDIEKYCKEFPIEVMLTHNVQEEITVSLRPFSFPVKTIYNPEPLGFAANHNQAFLQASGQFFCVLNPDIRLTCDPFHALIGCLQDAAVGVVAPLVTDGAGGVEDNARRFPTPLKILCKVVGRCAGGDYEVTGEVLYPDWLGGMFMLFPHAIFSKLGGFDQRYFLYYEDVDLCARLTLQGYRAALCPDVKVVHLARRESHRRLKYLKWHLASMLRFFCSKPFVKVCYLRLIGKL